jgi:hypothetical protein
MIILQILLFLLKLIGFLLLGILALALLLLIIVLFVPIRYRVRGHTGEGEKVEAFKNGEVNVKVSWLANLLAFHFDLIQGKKHMWVRILFFKLELGGDKEEDPEKAEKKRQKKLRKEQKREEKQARKEQKEEEKQARKDGKEAEFEDGSEQQILEQEIESDFEPECAPTMEGAPAELVTPVAPEEKCDSRPRPKRIWYKLINTIRNKIRGVFAAIKRVWRGIFEGIRKFRDKLSSIRKSIKNIRHKIKAVRAFLKDEGNRAALRHVFQELKAFLRYLLPTDFILDIVYNAGKPDITGKILGVLYWRQFMFKPHINIVPDFVSDNWFVKGDFFIKGRFRVVRVVRMAIRLLLDKNVRRLYKNAKELQLEVMS